jgi:hypothetical protein
VTTGGDGFRSAVDPVDENTVYSESQYGVLVRYDKATGQELVLQPLEGKGEPPLRWNWDSPSSSARIHTRDSILRRTNCFARMTAETRGS